MYIPPWTIVAGLGALSRQEICLLLPHFEETNLAKIATDKVRDISEKLQKKAETNVEAAFAKRLHDTSQKLMASPATDGALRARLWDHLLSAFSIDAGLPLSSRVANTMAADLAHRAAEVRADQFNKENDPIKRSPMAAAWRHVTSLFSKDKVDFSTIVVAQARLVASAVATAAKQGALGEIEKAELIRHVKAQIEQVPPALRSDALEKVLESSDKAILGLVASGSSLIGVGVAVKLAGFGAYIFAAQAAAIIPFVGGSTTVSMLFILANPLFIGPAILASAFLAGRHVKASHHRQLAASISIQLALRGVTAGRSGLRVAIDDFRQIRISDLKPLPAKRQDSLSDKLSFVRRKLGPPLPPAPWEPEGALSAPMGAADDAPIHRMLFSARGANADEAILVGGLTAGDILYDAVAIDPTVLRAVEFSSAEDISNIFNFGAFADRFSTMSGHSLAGAERRLRGYVAEQIVAARLVEEGHVVSLPETPNNPGFDLIVDGKEFQVKCLADISGLREHFGKYPDMPVFANGELAEKIAASTEEWASKVFFVEGYSGEAADIILKTAIDAGEALGDLNVPFFAVAVSTAKHLHGWWQGKTPLSDLPFVVVIDGAVKGGLSAAGGFSGGVLGLLVFGPAGALIFTGVGGAGAIVGANWTREQIVGLLSKEWSNSMDAAAKSFRSQLIVALQKKIDLLRAKQRQIDAQDHQFQPWLSARAADDVCGLVEHLFDLQQDTAEVSPVTRAHRYLQVMKDASIHPATVQDELSVMLKTLHDQPSLTESSSKAINGVWSALKDRLPQKT